MRDGVKIIRKVGSMGFLCLVSNSLYCIDSASQSPDLSVEKVQLSFSYYDQFNHKVLKDLNPRIYSIDAKENLDQIISSFNISNSLFSDFVQSTKKNHDESVLNCYARSAILGVKIDYGCNSYLPNDSIEILNFYQFDLLRAFIVKCEEIGCSKENGDKLKSYWTFSRFKKIRESSVRVVDELLSSDRVLCGIEEPFCHTENTDALFNGLFFTDEYILNYFQDQSIEILLENEANSQFCELLSIRSKYSSESSFKVPLSLAENDKIINFCNRGLK